MRHRGGQARSQGRHLAPVRSHYACFAGLPYALSFQVCRSATFYRQRPREDRLPRRLIHGLCVPAFSAKKMVVLRLLNSYVFQPFQKVTRCNYLDTKQFYISKIFEVERNNVFRLRSNRYLEDNIVVRSCFAKPNGNARKFISSNRYIRLRESSALCWFRLRQYIQTNA